MQLDISLSIIFGVITSISILSLIAALVINLRKRQKSIFAISLFSSAILYNISRIVFWVSIYIPLVESGSANEPLLRILVAVNSFLAGQILVSLLCLFHFMSFGKRLFHDQVFLARLNAPRVFVIITTIHFISQIIGCALHATYPVLQDCINLALFLLLLVGMICLFGTISLYSINSPELNN